MSAAPQAPPRYPGAPDPDDWLALAEHYASLITYSSSEWMLQPVHPCLRDVQALTDDRNLLSRAFAGFWQTTEPASSSQLADDAHYLVLRDTMDDVNRDLSAAAQHVLTSDGGAHRGDWCDCGPGGGEHDYYFTYSVSGSHGYGCRACRRTTQGG